MAVPPWKIRRRRGRKVGKFAEQHPSIDLVIVGNHLDERFPLATSPAPDELPIGQFHHQAVHRFGASWLPSLYENGLETVLAE